MFPLLISASLAASGGATMDQDIFVLQLATPSGQATIVQSGPAGKKPIVRKRIGPGYNIIEQDIGGNRAVIIQQDQGGK
jgi:hypothetical protein